MTQFATVRPSYFAPILSGSRAALQAEFARIPREIAQEHNFVHPSDAAAEAQTALAFQQTTAVAWRNLMGSSPAIETQRAIPAEQHRTANSPTFGTSTQASISGLPSTRHTDFLGFTAVSSLTVPGTGVTHSFTPAPIPTLSSRVQQQRIQQAEAFFAAHPEFANIAPTDADAHLRRSAAFRVFLASRPDLTAPLGIEVTSQTPAVTPPTNP